MEEFLRHYFRVPPVAPEELAIREAEEGIKQVLRTSRLVELSPQGPSLRRIQQQMAEQSNLRFRCKGAEPRRCILIYK